MVFVLPEDEAGVDPEGGGCGLLLRACNPPTTPPMIATATRSANIKPKNSQNLFRLRPQIFGSGGMDGGESTSPATPFDEELF